MNIEKWIDGLLEFFNEDPYDNNIYVDGSKLKLWEDDIEE